MTPCIEGQHLRRSDRRAMTRDGKRYAYRVAWEEVHGPLPRTVLLHHLCENPACVRLDHLSPITHAEHQRAHADQMSASHIASRTACPQGHPYDGTKPLRNGRHQRTCSTCSRESSRRSKARARARLDRP